MKSPNQDVPFFLCPLSNRHPINPTVLKSSLKCPAGFTLPAFSWAIPSSVFVHERWKNNYQSSLWTACDFSPAIPLFHNRPRHPALIPFIHFCHNLWWISLLCGVRESFKLFSIWLFALCPAFRFMMWLRGEGSLKGGWSRYALWRERVGESVGCFIFRPYVCSEERCEMDFWAAADTNMKASAFIMSHIWKKPWHIYDKHIQYCSNVWGQ